MSTTHKPDRDQGRVPGQGEPPGQDGKQGPAEDGIGADSRATADDSTPATLNGTPAVTGAVTWGGGGRG